MERFILPHDFLHAISVLYLYPITEVTAEASAVSGARVKQN
ncbi:hypothetical protein [Winslowiella toletana]|nr:hypothetical protein [Winslowiella toletana]WNN44934.1 hypothetical protein RIN69_03210 [Winslowiella toletana]